MCPFIIPVAGVAYGILGVKCNSMREDARESLIRCDLSILRQELVIERLRARVLFAPQRDGHCRADRPHHDALDVADA